jgi:hypothetical protein
MSNVPQSLIRLLEITKGGKGSGRKPGHNFGGNQYVKYDENGNPIATDRSPKKTPSVDSPTQEEPKPLVEPKIQRAIDASTAIASMIHIPEARRDTYIKNLTTILTDKESYELNYSRQKDVQTADTTNGAILGMLGYTAKPKVVSTDEFNKIDSTCYYSGLNSGSKSVPIPGKMSNLLYGETPRYGGPMFGAAFYTSEKVDTPMSYATNQGNEQAIFRFKWADPSNVYNENTGTLTSTTAFTDVVLPSSNKTIWDANGLTDIMKENGYSDREISQISIAFSDSSMAKSITPALAGYDGYYAGRQNYMMGLNRGAMIFPDTFIRVQASDNATVRNAISNYDLGSARGLTEETVPQDKVLTTSKSYEPSEVLEKGDVVGHVFHGNQWQNGFGGGSSKSAIFRYSRVVAHQMYVRATTNEPDITAHLFKVANSTGGTPVKPEFRIKAEASLSRKIRSDAQDLMGVPGETPRSAIEKAGADIGDSLRYTISYPDAKFGAGVSETLKQMQDTFGYVPLKIKNYFNDDPGNSYRGINCVFKDPKTSQLFELQFHTPSSSAMVEEVHGLYEKYRVLDKSSDEYEAGQQQMRSLWGTVPIPPGAEGIGAHSVKKQLD